MKCTDLQFPIQKENRKDKKPNVTSSIFSTLDSSLNGSIEKVVYKGEKL